MNFTATEEPAMSNQSIVIPTTDDTQIARYIDWAGDGVYVERTNDGEITIGEVEHGGTYTVAEALETLALIDAPAEVIDWARATTR